jgi:hypothetical protein
VAGTKRAPGISAAALALALVAAVSPAARADHMTFHWPAPVKVAVTEKVLKGGVGATLRYDLSVQPAPGGGLTVRLTDVRFVEIGGQDLRNPAVRKQLDPGLNASAALPTLVIAPDGTFADVRDVDRTIKEMALASKPKSAVEKKAMAAMFKSPQLRLMLKQNAAELWSMWVGLWANADLEPGRTREVSQQIPLPDGGVIERPLRVTHHGPAGPPGYVRLSFQATMEANSRDKSLRRLIDGMVRDLAGSGRPIPPELVESVQNTSAAEVITDPSTLQMVAAAWNKEVAVQVKGQPPRAQAEVHEYTFTWPKGRSPEP